MAIDAGKLDGKAVVNAEALIAAGVVRRVKDGVKLLGNGELKAKLAFEVAAASKGAIEAVEKAGGSVKVLTPVASGRSLILYDGGSPASLGGPRLVRRGFDTAEHQMASAAEQLAANINWSAFSKADELKKRIWFTLGALIVYRLGTYIPVPGIEPGRICARVQHLQPGHPRPVQHVLRRRRRPHGDLRARHHALYLRLDHHPASDDGRRRSSRR